MAQRTDLLRPWPFMLGMALPTLLEEVDRTYPENVGKLLERRRATATSMLYLPYGSRREAGSRRKLSLGESGVDSQLLEGVHVYLHGPVIYSKYLTIFVDTCKRLWYSVGVG